MRFPEVDVKAKGSGLLQKSFCFVHERCDKCFEVVEGVTVGKLNAVGRLVTAEADAIAII